MTTLLLENFKLLVLALWIGSTIVLAKLGNATKGKHAGVRVCLPPRVLYLLRR